MIIIIVLFYALSRVHAIIGDVQIVTDVLFRYNRCPRYNRSVDFPMKQQQQL